MAKQYLLMVGLRYQNRAKRKGRKIVQKNTDNSKQLGEIVRILES